MADGLAHGGAAAAAAAAVAAGVGEAAAGVAGSAALAFEVDGPALSALAPATPAEHRAAIASVSRYCMCWAGAFVVSAPPARTTHPRVPLPCGDASLLTAYTPHLPSLTPHKPPTRPDSIH